MEESAEKNEVTKFLLKELKINQKDVKKVIDILSSEEGNLDTKIQGLQNLKIKNLDGVISTICLFMLDDAMMKSYCRVVLSNEKSIENMITAPPMEIRDLLLILTSMFQCQLNSSGDKLGVLFLILPMLRLTGIIPMNLMIKILQILAKEYDVSMKKLIETSNIVTTFFLKDFMAKPQNEPEMKSMLH